jgi:predicted metal-binding membrane protein
MTGDSLVQGAMRRERVLVVCGLLAVIGMAWAYLLTGAGTMQEMGDMLMPMSSGPWTLAHALVMFVMWAVMMAAMMLPSAAPMILLYSTIAYGRTARGESVAGSAVFTAGYVTVWAGFSLAAVSLQFGLEAAALLSPMMEASSVVLAALLLIAAGAYQWTPLKQACLKHCRSPLDFVLTQWREGRGGAFVMGLRHGTYCLGCCWMLMLLLFVGGVMNLVWIAALAAYVLVEKLAPAGHWVGRITGLLLIGWGIAMLVGMSGLAQR